jgi:anti-anti-sigma regulatory factor
MSGLRKLKEDDCITIRARSYLNARSGDALAREFEEGLATGTRHFVIDFAETDIINSIGVSAIIGIIERLLQCRGTVRCANLSPVNEEIFGMMGILKYAPPLRGRQ